MSFTGKSRRILGMNARNLLYIRPHNNARAVQLARNKLETKKRLLQADLPTAGLYAVIKNRHELFDFDWSALPNSFVLKPNFGLGGNGIIILYGKTKTGQWVGGDKTPYSQDDLAIHVSNILDGNYSISNIPDIAYFEERLTLAETFKHISYKGIPDIRVIVFNSVPVQAMLRLPTKASSGKANLHIGGIGVGIDLSTGVTTYATSKELGEISLHPDYNTSLRGVQIPQWNEILRISVEAQRTIGLGYAGVDIVLDKQKGPVILEVNGHPGLEIQNANYSTLRDRLQRVSGLQILDAQQGIKVCKNLFGREELSDHDSPVLGVFETVVITDRHDKSVSMRVRIDTGLVSTTITKDLAKRLGFTAVLTALEQVVFPSVVPAARAQQVEDSYKQSLHDIHSEIVDVVAVRRGDKYAIRPKVALQFILAGKTITTAVAIDIDNTLSHPMIIGRRDLAGFLVNPSKTK